MIDIKALDNDPWTTFPVKKDDLKEIVAENELLRSALLFYAEHIKNGDTDYAAHFDNGDIARAALRTALPTNRQL
jgi:hypothetical protein